MKSLYKAPLAALALSGILAGCGGSGSHSRPVGNTHKFSQTNLVSDQAGAATVEDSDLVNAWGIAFSPTGPFWISDNGTGKATIYNGSGAKQGLIVNVSGVGTANAPVTGQVFNSTASFIIPGSTKALFIFSTEDGVISAWNSGTQAGVVADRSGTNAIYKGLAIGNSGGNDFLYATNFHSGSVDVFGADFGFVKSFTDSGVPAGYAPFGIQNIDGLLYVTFAKQDADKEDDVAGAGNGYVDVFDMDGNLVRRLASRGSLNSPWGLVKASVGFGGFDNAILVGNFDDGRISAFDPTSGQFLGQMNGASGHPVEIPGLWALAFGNGGQAGSTANLYFTAGPGGEAHGLFGYLTPNP